MTRDQVDMQVRSFRSVTDVPTLPFHQFVIACDGRMEIETAGKKGVIHSRYAAICLAGKHHIYRCEGRNRILTVKFWPEAVELTNELNHIWEFAQREVFFPLDLGMYHHIQVADQQLKKSLVTPDFSRSWSSVLLLMLKERLECMRFHYPRRVQRALDFIHCNFTSNINAKDICNAAGLSSGHLYTLFRTHLGDTPNEYITKLRLDKAQDLLVNSSLEIAQIAMQIGYSDQSALTKSLRKCRGLTPNTYRQQCWSGLAKDAFQISKNYSNRSDIGH